MATINFEEWLKQSAGAFAPVVPYAQADKFLRMDFTAANTELTDDVLKDTNLFTQWVNRKLTEAGARYGIGGYNENRPIYRRSSVFDTSTGPHPASPAEGRVIAQPSPATDAAPYPGEFYWDADVTVYKGLKVFVSQHRRHPTPAEELLWQRLRNNQLNGYSFRRQHVIGQFIADFVCLAKKLIIEVDGLQHQLPQNLLDGKDRTFWLTAKGYTVLRFTNNEVLKDTETVLKKISQQLMTLPFAEKRVYPKRAGSPQSEGRATASPPVGDLGGRSADDPSLRREADGMGRAAGVQPRSLHLGVDIWGAPYTRVMAPLDGIVHSFAFNNAFGDYGATIILTHNLGGKSFHTLYGHLSLNSLKNLEEGQVVKKGDVFCEFGIPFENGQWPPHLHFQIIKDMQGMKGDYPGVCAPSEKEMYLANCPDADLILGMMAKS